MKNFLSITNNSETIFPNLDSPAVKRALENDKKLAQIVADDAHIVYREKPYAVKNRKMYIAAWVVSIVFQLISVAIAMDFGVDLIGLMSAEIPTVTAWIFSVGVLLLIEMGKRITTDDIAEERLEYRTWSGFTWVLGILTVVSFVSSVGGSYNLAYNKSSEEILVNKQVDTLVTKDIGEEIAGVKEDIKEVRKTHVYAGKLTPAGIELDKTLQNRLDNLYASKTAKEANVKQGNEKLDIEAASSGSSSGWAAALFAAIIEVTIICSIVYTHVYIHKSKGGVVSTTSKSTGVGFSGAGGKSAVIASQDIQDELEPYKRDGYIGFKDPQNVVAEPPPVAQVPPVAQSLQEEMLSGGRVKVTALIPNKPNFVKIFDSKSDADDWKRHFHPEIEMREKALKSTHLKRELAEARTQPQTPPPPPPPKITEVGAPCENVITSSDLRVRKASVITKNETVITEKEPVITVDSTTALPKYSLPFTISGMKKLESETKCRVKRGEISSKTYTKNMERISQAKDIMKQQTGQYELFL